MTDNLPQGMKLKELIREDRYTFEEDINSRVDIEIPLQKGFYANSLKMGGRTRWKYKTRDNRFNTYEPLSDESFIDDMEKHPYQDYSISDYLAGDYQAGNFSTPEYLGGLDLDSDSKFKKIDSKEEYLTRNYDANEVILGTYLMLRQNFGKLSGIIGYRIEQTRVNYTSNGYDKDADDKITNIKAISGKSEYLNHMPALHLKYTPLKKLIFRFAWTNTLARPKYEQLVPSRVIVLGENELEEGNPKLKPTTSMNLDLMSEYYFESVGLVSGGVFFKNINDFVFDYRVDNYKDPVSGNLFNRYTQAQNGGTAMLTGFEVAFQRQLDFLPKILQGFGLYINYTYTSSTIQDFPLENRDLAKLELPGTATHTFNTSLSYETQKITFRISGNYTSDYIDEIGSIEFYDSYYDSQFFLDLNASYTVWDNLRIFLEANNLTNQPLRYYQGQRDRLRQEEFYDIRLNFGIKYDIN